MKSFIFCLLNLLVSNFILAQPFKPSFGKVEKQELLSQNCDFEENAPAQVLFDVGDFFFDIRFRSSFNKSLSKK